LEEIRFVQEHELGQPLMSLVGINNILETHSKEKDDSELESLIAMQKKAQANLMT